MLVLSLAAVAGVGAAAAWFVDRRKAGQRNTRGACGACGRAWSDRAGEPHLIHARLVCEPCADDAKRRVVWEFGVLAASAAVAVGFIVADMGLVAMVAFPIVTTLAMTFGAVQVMKLANREAQRRIATGDLPEYAALTSGEDAR